MAVRHRFPFTEQLFFGKVHVSRAKGTELYFEDRPSTTRFISFIWTF